MLNRTLVLQEGTYSITLDGKSEKDVIAKTESILVICWDCAGDDATILQQELTGQLDNLRQELNGKIDTETRKLQDQISNLQKALNDAIGDHDRDQAELLKKIEEYKKELADSVSGLRQKLSWMNRYVPAAVTIARFAKRHQQRILRRQLHFWHLTRLRISAENGLWLTAGVPPSICRRMPIVEMSSRLAYYAGMVPVIKARRGADAVLFSGRGSGAFADDQLGRNQDVFRYGSSSHQFPEHFHGFLGEEFKILHDCGLGRSQKLGHVFHSLSYQRDVVRNPAAMLFQQVSRLNGIPFSHHDQGCNLLFEQPVHCVREFRGFCKSTVLNP